MTAVDRVPSAWRPALTAGLAAFLAAALVAVVAVGVDMRSDLRGAGAVAQAAAEGASGSAGAGPVRLARDAAAEGLAARVLSRPPVSEVLAEAGPSTAWDAGSAPWYAEMFVAGSSGWSVLDGAVEAARTLPDGRRIVVRAALPGGATSVAPAVLVAGALACLAAALLAAGAVLWRRRRTTRALARLASAARTVAAASGSVGELPQGDLAGVSSALLAVRDRMAEVQALADVRVDGAEAVITPLSLPAAVRAPAGRELWNPALEALLGSLGAEDRDALRAAVSELLALGGRPAGRRVELAEDRVLEVESWATAGGRMVAVTERGEQERLRRLRRQLTGAAARHLRAPLAEIEARATELFTHVPAASAQPVQRILAAADRMERLVASMLRGTAHDPLARPPRLAPMSVSGLLWGLAQKWDRALRPQALRVEVDLAPELPAVLADAALLEEILTEVIDNAAKYTPRGGTVQLCGRLADGGGVALEVRDTGEGFDPTEIGNVTQPFFRGARSEALPGAGLGLGVAQALAERIGGRLAVHPGPGGRVVLVLPPAPAPETRELSASAA